MIKFVLLVPTRLNDGSEVPPEFFLTLQDDFFERYGGFTLVGEFQGAYAMSDGKRQNDQTLCYWLVIADEREGELKRHVAELGGLLGQESMFLEKTGGEVFFVLPADLKGDQE